MKKASFLILSVLLVFQGIKAAPKEEFRAVWVATVERLDWPSSSNVSSQKNQLITILNTLESYHFNAIIFQVRPACDAFYDSKIEPWSNWLTGTEGKAPDPYYDPLAFVIEEAHKRGIEVHAWFNPYRARKGNAGTSVNHVFNTHPEWILAIGSKQEGLGYKSLDEREFSESKEVSYILDPGKEVVRNYVLSVIVDVATRYDIDGVHMDDYFYPYSGMSNEDAATFNEENRGFSNIHDWRRDNVNLLIKGIHDTLQAINPRIKFGMSPFGIWKNGVPPGIVGLDAYSVIYCDAVTWLNEHWIDYITPQLYWPFEGGQDYGKLMPWWAGQAAKNDRHLYVGHAAYKITNWTTDEMPRQIRLNWQTDAALGSVFFRYAFMPGGNPLGFRDSLKNYFYAHPAIPPAMTWKDSILPPAPVNFIVTLNESDAILIWQAGEMTEAHDDTTYRYLLYKWPLGESLNRDDNSHLLAVIPASEPLTYTDTDFENYQYAISALDRLSNESDVIEQILNGIDCFNPLAEGWQLHPAFPNPFNPTVHIMYTLPKATDVHLFIFDIIGRQIYQETHSHDQAGTYTLEWNASGFASGIYFVKIKTPEFEAAQKISYLK